MNKRPVMFFLAMMITGTALIIAYLQTVNPRQTNAGISGHQHAYNKNLAASLYQNHCAECHGSDGRGIMSNPALTGTNFSETQIIKIIQNGRGEMSAVDGLDENQMHQIAHFVKHLQM